MAEEKTRRGRPTRADSAKYGRLPKGWQDRLLKVAVTAVVQDEKHITLRVHRLTKLPRYLTCGARTTDWPYYEYKLNAMNIVRWLNKQGYSSVSTEDLRVMQIRLSRMEGELLRDYP